VTSLPPILKTLEGSTWLEQFHEQDREKAIEYTRLLSLVDQTTLEESLSRKIEEILAVSSDTVGAFAIRPRAFTTQAQGIKLTAKDKHFHQESQYFLTRDSSPTTTLSQPGSEGRIAHFIETVAQSRQRKMLSHPSISRMAKAQTRRVLLVTDFIGTGKEVADFLWMFHNSKTCMSWSSRKQIQYVVLCYAATRHGLQTGIRERLKQLYLWDREERKNRSQAHQPSPVLHCAPRQLLKLNIEIISCQIAPTADEILSSSELADFEDFCTSEKYVVRLRSKDRQFTLGYKGLAGLMAFSYRCPNNVPCIFWSNNPPFWSPIFPARRVMPGQQSSFTSSLDLKRKSAERRITTAGVHETNWTTFVLLDALRKGIQRPQTLARYMQLTQKETEAALRLAQSHGLIGEENKITPAAWRNCEASKRALDFATIRPLHLIRTSIITPDFRGEAEVLLATVAIF